jgi:hypothetical protein
LIAGVFFNTDRDWFYGALGYRPLLPRLHWALCYIGI